MSMFSEDEDLGAVWDKLIAQCNDRAGWDLNSNQKPTVEGVLAKMNPSKDNKSKTHDTAKKIFRQTLYCIDKFGKIAAQAASMAFGPSQQCFNAISFVITAIQDYDAVFSNVTVLMERVSAFLERLRIYLDDIQAETKVDKRLRLTMYRVLEHFMTVLSIWHKLTHSRTARLKLAAKVTVFGEDEGVKSAIQKLEVLIQDFTGTEISLIVKTVSEAARNILVVEKKLDAIADSSEKTAATLGRLENAEEERKRLEDIREAMSIDKDRRPWIQKQDELSGKQTSGTGKWLLEYDQSISSFPRWSDPKASSLNALSIVAEGGYGKSYLCSIVVDYLREKHGSDPRVCIAYYYLQREALDKNAVNSAIKAIIYQLASAPTPASREYAKLAQKVCAGKADFGKTADLWKRLIAAFAKSLNATFFIVLDGIDEAETEADKPLSSIVDHIMSADETASLKIRLLVTGRPDGLDDFKRLSLPVPSIAIAPADKTPLNQGDIIIHAQKRLDEMAIFDTDDEELIKLKNRAREELTAGVRGNYIALESKLDSLAKSHNERDAESVISRAQETRMEEIARKMKHLNATLSVDEKTELNEMLMWAATCLSNLNLDQYKAVLLLKTGTKVLASLETQIRNMYNFLFTINDSKALSLCPDIEDYLIGNEETKALFANSGSGNSAEAIQDSEIHLVKRLLRTHFRYIFGDEETYNRFAFDDFFESKRTSRTSHIHLKAKPENHLRLAQACLVSLCDHISGGDDYASLHPYAWEYFANHLSAAEDAELDTAAVQEIGRKLVRILRDTSLIDAWWVEDYVYGSRYGWVREPDLAQAVCRWLKRPTVQKVLQDMPTDRQWVLENIGDDRGAVAILSDVAKRLAQHWFDLKDELWRGCIYFLYEYLSNMRGEEPSHVISARDVLAAKEWAKKKLGNGDAVTQWSICMAATFFELHYWKEAIEWYCKAIATGKQSWRLHFGLARAFRANKQPNEAIKALEQLIKDNPMQPGSETPDDFQKSYWEIILPELALTTMDAMDFIRAEKTYRTVLDESFKNNEFTSGAMQAVVGLSRAFAKQGKHHEIVQLLGDLMRRPDEECGNWLCLLFHACSEWDNFHGRIHSAARSADSLDFIAESYHFAIEIAKSAISKYSAFLSLRSQLASLLWSNRLIEDREVALQLWEANIEGKIPEGVEDEWVVRWVRSQSVSKLTCVLSEIVKTENAEEATYLETKEHIENLVQVVKANGEDYDDSNADLARLLRVAGEEDRARDLVRDKLKEHFDDISDLETFKYEFWTVKVIAILRAFDDDTNAIAAWSLALPDKDEQSQDLKSGGDSSADPSAAKSAETPKEGTAIPESLDEPQVQAREEVKNPPSDSLLTNGVEVSNAKDEAKAPAEEPELRGPIGFSCDGRCGLDWTYADDMWVCKDCADVQFDSKCYEKLKNGTLDEEVCGREHSHFHIPPFDKERWRTTPDDQMWVGGALMPKKDWVEGIKKEWKIDKESLAATKIQGVWRDFSATGTNGRALTRRQTLPLQ